MVSFVTHCQSLTIGRATTAAAAVVDAKTSERVDNLHRDGLARSALTF